MAAISACAESVWHIRKGAYSLEDHILKDKEQLETWLKRARVAHRKRPRPDEPSEATEMRL